MQLPIVTMLFKVNQFYYWIAKRFIINSPGGLLPPVTVDNILQETKWRNRRIAEVFKKLV